MPVWTHKIIHWRQMNTAYRQRESEGLNIWPEKNKKDIKKDYGGLNKNTALLARGAGLQCLMWSQHGSLCVFLSPLSGLRQGSSSPEVMMASFLAEIWKEKEILWLSSERWLFYWDATNKGWCRPGIPRLAPSPSLFFPSEVSFQLPLISLHS